MYATLTRPSKKAYVRLRIILGREPGLAEFRAFAAGQPIKTRQAQAEAG
jgi:hypothetical protein